MPPVYSIAAFAVTVAYVPWFADAANAPRWVLLSLIVPWAGAKLITAAHRWYWTFLLGATLSLLWTPVLIEGLQPWWQFVLLGSMLCIGADADTLEPVFVGAGWGMAVSSAVALFQHEPTGLFLNKNFMAEAAVLVFMGLRVYGRDWLSLLLLPAILLPNARGALLALTVAMGVEFRSKWLFAGLFAVLVASVLWTQDGATIGQRYVIWSETLKHLTWFGHGIGSFYIDFPGFREGGFAVRLDHTHNDLLELVYEFGLGAGLAIMVAAFALLRSSPMKPVLVAFLVEGCFGFPLFMPVTGALAAVVTGYLCSSWYRLRDDVPARKYPLCLGTRQFGLRRREVSPAAGG